MANHMFNLPDIGEGVNEGEIVTWLVAEGATVKEDQPLVEIMTDKATVEIAAPVSGTVVKHAAPEGDSVNVGELLAEIATDGAAAASSAPQAAEQPAAPAPTPVETPAASPAPAQTPSAGGVHTFNLPDIGEGVNEGEIVSWLVAEGSEVKEDQPLVEIMTDKATVEIAAPVSGTVIKHAAPEGNSVNVGELLAEIATAGGGANTTAAPALTASTPASTASAPAASSNVISMPAANISAAQNGLVLASPATRKFAREQNIALASIPGTGKNGRVLRSDVELFVANGGTSAAAVATPSVAQTAPKAVANISPDQLEERIKLKGIRKAIAKNMQLSKNTAAHFTHVNELEADELVRVRGMLKQEAADQGAKLTYLPFIIKAICGALKEYPKLNSSLDEATQEIVVKHYYNIGVAVATKDDDLIVPVIKNADQKGLIEIANEIVELADKARNNKLSPEELQGGTFTLTSMGNDGGLLATPVINYPQVGILGFYKIADRVVVRDGQMVIRKIANLSVSIDHRVVDGMMGANFMSSVIRNLENPSRMLL